MMSYETWNQTCIKRCRDYKERKTNIPYCLDNPCSSLFTDLFATSLMLQLPPSHELQVLYSLSSFQEKCRKGLRWNGKRCIKRREYYIDLLNDATLGKACSILADLLTIQIVKFDAKADQIGYLGVLVTC